MKSPFCALCFLVMSSLLLAQGSQENDAENASNPLAAVNNTDLRAQYFDVFGSDKEDYWLSGAYMVNPDLMENGVK